LISSKRFYRATGDAFSHALDVRLTSAVRFVLAGAALLVVYIDPSQPVRLVALTYSLLTLYIIYSALIWALSFLAPRFLVLVNWVDLAWYVILIAVSSTGNSVFFFFFFFVILAASFHWGFRSGLRLTLASTILFAIVGFASSPPGTQFELKRFTLRLIVLLVVGDMVAHWGGADVTLKRRLQFLKDITNLSNPRFGIDRTMSGSVERLRSFYDADACLLIQPRSENSYRLVRVDRGGSDAATFTKEINAELATLLLLPGPGKALVYIRGSLKSRVYDIDNGKTSREAQSYVTAIANALDTKAFVSVPILNRDQTNGRLYLLGTSRPMNRSDIDFVLHVIEQVFPLLENIGLVDRLASDAAEQERQKFTRDIHDRVIQPFVGLQLGLIALREKLANTNSSGFKDLNKLCELATDEMNELRRYLTGLKSGAGRVGVLLPAVRRFASKYSADTGIPVQVKGIEDLRLNDRLAAEAFQMVAEGLSNVRRHTNARQAEIEVTCDNTELILRIMNDNADSAAKTSFRPGSITERAAALGGVARVYADNDRTVVDVRIPL
jgi:signal transduction histidine kinase